MKRLLFLLMFLAVPLKAQYYFGDIRPDSAGFWVDTLESPKIEKAKPWFFELKSNPVVEQIWTELASCEGLNPKDEFRFIKFVEINQVQFGGGIYKGKLLHFIGYTLINKDGHFTIYLSAFAVQYKSFVRHEMLHVLLSISGYPMGHPAPWFDRCGVDRGAAPSG